ncbi:hypothetical protein D3C72_979550 [compost metagenome]
MACEAFSTLVFDISSAFNEVMAVVLSIFFLVPYPMTTTSFNSVSLDSFKVMVIGSAVAAIDKASKPTKLIFKISPTLALIEKLPSKSVSAVVFESAATINAPGIPIPF